jgi:hypothetical protein
MWGPGESEVSWRCGTVPLAKWIEQKPSSKAESLFFYSRSAGAYSSGRLAAAVHRLQGW